MRSRACLSIDLPPLQKFLEKTLIIILTSDIFAIILRAGTVANLRPSFRSVPRGEDFRLNVGERLKWCVSGVSLGVHDLQWAWSLDPSLETVNISASIVSKNPCLKCACAESEYYSSNIVQEYLRNKTMGGARGVAFSVLGYNEDQFLRNYQCSGVPTNFLSFVIIDGVRPSDNRTEMTFNVISFTGDNTQGNYPMHTCMYCF